MKCCHDDALNDSKIVVKVHVSMLFQQVCITTKETDVIPILGCLEHKSAQKGRIITPVCSDLPVRLGQALQGVSRLSSSRSHTALHTSHLMAFNLISQIKCELPLLAAFTRVRVRPQGSGSKAWVRYPAPEVVRLVSAGQLRIYGRADRIFTWWRFSRKALRGLLLVPGLITRAHSCLIPASVPLPWRSSCAYKTPKVAGKP